MPVLVLTRAEVRELLDLDELIDALAEAMAHLSSGRASNPDRVAAIVPERDGLLGAMPGYLPAPAALMGKLVSVFPGNAGADIPTHQALIAVFDPQNGTPAALLDGTEITAARTGACSALSVRLLAREDAAVLGLLGTGVQARSHARAVVRVRPIEEIVIAGREPRRADAVGRELGAELGVAARAVASYREAIEAADVVCATTHAVDPVVRGEWLSPGTHVTSVGFNAVGRELDDQTVVKSLVSVESRRAALAPPPAGTNDLLGPIAAGLITAEHVHAELGELVSGSKPGRSSSEQITLYKSVGVAVQDAAAAALVLGRARAAGVGSEIAL